MSLNYFSLIFVSVLLNSIAQLVLKAGTNTLGTLFIPEHNFVLSLYRIFTQPYILCGLVIYVISFCLWIVVLSKLEVSIAYPLLSIGYLISLIFGYLLFNEPITFNKIIGIGFLIVGVIFMSR